MSSTQTITFKPKQVTKRLISVLSERAQDIVRKRYGLDTSTDKRTLESIGEEYDITRERVRQIENHSLNAIRKSDAYDKEQENFEQLRDLIHSMGCLVSEKDLLNAISKSESIQNHVHFMLVVSDLFIKEKEDDHFKHRWCIDTDLSEKIQKTIKKIYSSLDDDALVTEPDMIKTFLNHLEDVSDELKNDEIAKRWLSVSKRIDKNPLGEWGKAESPNINAKGMRDYAYLVIRKHGSPIHFREVAKSIEKVFGKKAHVATTHNELIKDGRFILVGRGLYALSEWGYMSGVVKDVIEKILEKNGPLTREEVIDRVLKERYVKENTIIVNLQNSKSFKKNKDGKYILAK